MDVKREGMLGYRPLEGYKPDKRDISTRNRGVLYIGSCNSHSPANHVSCKGHLENAKEAYPGGYTPLKETFQ